MYLNRDTLRSTACRLIKLRALTRSHNLQHATKQAIDLLYGACLPHITTTGYSPVEDYPLSSKLDCSKSLYHEDNLQVYLYTYFLIVINIFNFL